MAEKTVIAGAVEALAAGAQPANEDAKQVQTLLGKPGAADLEIVRNQDDNSWTILRKNKDGSSQTNKDQGHIAAITPMDEGDAVMVFLELASKLGSKREAAMTLLCNIMQDQLASIEPWQGKGVPTEGLDRTLSGQFQRCEDKYFDRFMNADHPNHKMFVGRLPKTDMRNKPLHINGKLVPQKQFDAFMTATRSDVTYAQMKGLCLQLFSLVGRLPYDEDGNIIPPEVIRVMVQKARIIVPTDNSFRAKLAVLYRTMVADSEEAEKPADDDMPLIFAMLEKMAETAKEMQNLAAIRATAKAKPGDVIQSAADAIDKARQALSGPQDAKIAEAQASTQRQVIAPEAIKV